MGHAWLWLESKRESPSDSVKSSDCLSLSSSWDSSLDLEVGSWRVTEEPALEEPEESSQEEEDCRLESSEPLAWEDGSEEFQEEAGQREQDSLLQFLLEVTHLMEPLCISGTDSAQSHWTFRGSGEQEEREVLSSKEEMVEPLVPRGEKRQLQVLIEEAGELHVPGREVGEKWVPQVSGELQVLGRETGEAEEQEIVGEVTGEPQVSEGDSGEQRELHFPVENAGEMAEEEKNRKMLMDGTSESSDMSVLKEQLPASVQAKVLEEPEEHAPSERHLLEGDNDLSVHDDSDSCSSSRASLVDSFLLHPASSQLMPLSWDNPLRHLLFKKTLLSIWKMIASHRYSGPFLKPVSDKQAPGYKDVVRRPMDLTNIKRRLSKGQIRTTAQFQRDLMLMFQNAVMYNSSDHHVHRMAVEMQRDVLEQLQLLGEALLCSEERLDFGRR